MAAPWSMNDYQIELAYHGFGDLDPVTVQRAVSNAYEEMCQMERWPWLIRETTGDVTPANPVLNTSFDPPIETIVSVTTNVPGSTLVPIELAEFRKRFAGVYLQTGPPIYYYLSQDVGSDALDISVWPKPDTTYTLWIAYRGGVQTLTSPADVPSMVPHRYQRLILYLALSLLHAQEDNPQMAGYWENRFMNGIARMREDAWTQQTDRPDYVLNVADADEWP